MEKQIINEYISKSSATSSREGLRKLFIRALREIYFVEQTLVNTIPKMKDKAASWELTDALTDHLEVTEAQVSRVEDIFSLIGEKAEPKTSEAILSLTKEVEEIMKETERGAVRDSGIILTAQKVEHYEIATYDALYAFARILGENEAASLLKETLEEEKEAGEIFSEIAIYSIQTEMVAEE